MMQMNQKNIFFSGDLLQLTVIIVFSSLVLFHIVPCYEAYKIRNRVLHGLKNANQAKELVINNALHGEKFAEGWVEGTVVSNLKISIDELKGIVTIIYPKDIENGYKTLILIPAYLKEDKLIPLYAEVNSKSPLVASNIKWICTSNLLISKHPFISDNIGTLSSKYAPASCRFSEFEKLFEKNN